MSPGHGCPEDSVPRVTFDPRCPAKFPPIPGSTPQPSSLHSGSEEAPAERVTGPAKVWAHNIPFSSLPQGFCSPCLVLPGPGMAAGGFATSPVLLSLTSLGLSQSPSLPCLQTGSSSAFPRCPGPSGMALAFPRAWRELSQGHCPAFPTSLTPKAFPTSLSSRSVPRTQHSPVQVLGVIQKGGSCDSSPQSQHSNASLCHPWLS